jgi:hypothetical protein
MRTNQYFQIDALKKIVQWLTSMRYPSHTPVRVLNIHFIIRYFFNRVAPQLSLRGWVDPVPDLLLLRKSDRAGDRTRDLGDCSQKLWPLEHRGGPPSQTDKYLNCTTTGEFMKINWKVKCVICTIYSEACCVCCSFQECRVPGFPFTHKRINGFPFQDIV